MALVANQANHEFTVSEEAMELASDTGRTADEIDVDYDLDLTGYDEPARVEDANMIDEDGHLTNDEEMVDDETNTVVEANMDDDDLDLNVDDSASMPDDQREQVGVTMPATDDYGPTLHLEIDNIDGSLIDEHVGNHGTVDEEEQYHGEHDIQAVGIDSTTDEFTLEEQENHTEPIPSHSHPVIFHFSGSETDKQIHLVKPNVASNDTHQWLSESHDFPTKNFAEIFTSLRAVLKTEIEDDHVLEMRFTFLRNLGISENCVEAQNNRFSDTLDLYVGFCEKDDIDEPEPFAIVVLQKPSFDHHFRIMQNAFLDGSGYSAFIASRAAQEFFETHEVVDNNDLDHPYEETEYVENDKAASEAVVIATTAGGNITAKGGSADLPEDEHNVADVHPHAEDERNVSAEPAGDSAKPVQVGGNIVATSEQAVATEVEAAHSKGDAEETEQITDNVHGNGASDPLTSTTETESKGSEIANIDGPLAANIEHNTASDITVATSPLGASQQTQPESRYNTATEGATADHRTSIDEKPLRSLQVTKIEDDSKDVIDWDTDDGELTARAFQGDTPVHQLDESKTYTNFVDEINWDEDDTEADNDSNDHLKQNASANVLNVIPSSTSTTSSKKRFRPDIDEDEEDLINYTDDEDEIPAPKKSRISP